MSQIEETIAAIQSKVLDLEKDLAGLKGTSYNKLKAEIEALNDRLADFMNKAAATPPATPPKKKDEPEPDTVAALLDGE